MIDVVPQTQAGNPFEITDLLASFRMVAGNVENT
jgi:hypothetical protein